MRLLVGTRREVLHPCSDLHDAFLAFPLLLARSRDLDAKLLGAVKKGLPHPYVGRLIVDEKVRGHWNAIACPVDLVLGLDAIWQPADWPTCNSRRLFAAYFYDNRQLL
jgi:hypothetical protein